MADYEVIVIGGGPNGLMASAILATEGKKVLCLEQSDHVGGLASNAHDFPGYVHNRGMWYLMFAQVDALLNKLELSKYGLELMDPPQVATIVPENYGDPVLRLYNSPAQTMQGIAETFGQKNLEGFIKFNEFLAPFAVGMEPAMANPPMSIAQMMDAVPSQEGQRALQTIFYGNAMELVDRFIPKDDKNAALRGFIGCQCCDGFFGGPMTPGSALTIAYHFGTPAEGEGANGSQYKLPKGHMGMFAESIAKSFEGHGGTLKKNAKVAEILVKNNKAYGVKLADGTEISGDVIVSSCDAYNTFINMMDEANCPVWLRNSIRQINYRETLIQMYVTLKGRPEFGEEYAYLNEDNWNWTVWAVGDMEAYEQDWDALKSGLCVPRPRGGFYMPSVLDPSLAPDGCHTGTFCISNAWPFDVPANKVDSVKEDIANKLIDHWTTWMPNFRDCVQDWKVMAPQDYEAIYSNTGGTWTHEMIQIDQMFDLRPVKGMSNYKAPIGNLYLCGSSNHPGPGVNGRAPQICLDVMRRDGVI